MERTLRIAHIADVHVRGLSRHAEYREVFIDFVKQVKRDAITHIFVGGDIFHTKTSGISPEYIDFMNWWLTEMASTAEVHLTLGNHDGNLVNMSRQDAITPIVEALSNKRVHLYKKSGVYEIEPGFNLCIFSLFDEEGWKNVEPKAGDVNIACYHGPVWGAHTETGWLIEDGLTVDFFSKFDFCFLGDIHKLQFLDFRESELVIDEDDLSKYPGAVIVGDAV